MNNYYNTEISSTVKNTATRKNYRIRKIEGVPYVTLDRRTRVLFENPTGGAYINIKGSRVYFV